jgi:hypothetical protein
MQSLPGCKRSFYPSEQKEKCPDRIVAQILVQRRIMLDGSALASATAPL